MYVKAFKIARNYLFSKHCHDSMKLFEKWGLQKKEMLPFWDYGFHLTSLHMLWCLHVTEVLSKLVKKFKFQHNVRVITQFMRFKTLTILENLWFAGHVWLWQHNQHTNLILVGLTGFLGGIVFFCFSSATVILLSTHTNYVKQVRSSMGGGRGCSGVSSVVIHCIWKNRWKLRLGFRYGKLNNMVYPRIARHFFMTYDIQNFTKNLRKQMDEWQTEHKVDLKQQDLLLIHKTQQRWVICSLLTFTKQRSTAVVLKRFNV